MKNSTSYGKKMNMKNEHQDELPFYKVDKTFVRLMNAVIDKELLAEMRPAGLACLLVVKRYVPYDGISSWPSHNLIAKKTGLTRQTVKKTLQKLIDLGWLRATKRGRGWEYNITEKFYAISQEPEVRPDGWLETTYGPLEIQKKSRAIASFERTGEVPAGMNFNACTFNVEINNFYDQAAKVKQEINTVVDPSVLDGVEHPYYRERLQAILARAAAQVDVEVKQLADESGGEPVEGTIDDGKWVPKKP